MSEWIQLWVERQAMDPSASTALAALQLLLGRDAPVKVGRADLWELLPSDGEGDAAERFETWLRGSNLFLNPNRDRGVVLGGVAPVPGPSVASVVTIERGAADSRAHALTLAHALGGTWRVRRGTVWTLLWPPERTDDVPALAEKAAWARRRSSGLLVNPESQDAVVLIGSWANPALPNANNGTPRAEGEPGSKSPEGEASSLDRDADVNTSSLDRAVTRAEGEPGSKSPEGEAYSLDRAVEDKLNEECAVFGIFGAERASELAQLGLYALQHRGQESCGIVSVHDGRFFVEKGIGLVVDVMTPERLARLPGRQAIGHNRYSTTGGLNLANTQPLTASIRGEEVAIAHNGNLVNARIIRRRLEESGSIFQTSLDTEVFLHLLAQAEGDFEERLLAACREAQGAYALVLQTDSAVYGLRDPNGWRPLVLGKLESGAHVLASESCALDLLGARMVREVEAGELVRLDARGVTARPFLPKGELKQCLFEHVYFSRPDSVVFGETVDRVRRKIGHRLAQEHPVDADLVISVPDSSNSIALGYAEESGIPFELGLIRNHYVGRTFIHPTQAVRDHSVRVKFNTVEAVLRDKRVVMVDDSIVRGTTSRKLVALVRRAGAKEIHFRVGSPPVSYPCFYGIDTPSRAELIGARLSLEEIRAFLAVDSVGYISLEGLKACETREGAWCDACWSGRYPIPPEPTAAKLSLEGPRLWSSQKG